MNTARCRRAAGVAGALLSAGCGSTSSNWFGPDAGSGASSSSATGQVTTSTYVTTGTTVTTLTSTLPDGGLTSSTSTVTTSGTVTTLITSSGSSSSGMTGSSTSSTTSSSTSTRPADAGACSANCSNASTGSCSSPQVRITSVNIGAALSYSTDETYALPLAIAAKPGGGSRLAWVTGYAHYGSSTASQVHVADLDCSDNIVGTPFTLPGHDFQDLAADVNGGVVVLTRDAQGGPDAQHCGDVNNLCVLPSDRPGCYDTYMVRHDCAGNEQWATKLTTSSSTVPPYTAGAGGGANLFVWWYQHHGRLAYDGTNYAAYFCDAITIANNSCSAGAGKVDIHQGDRMQVVDPTGALLTGHDSFAGGCSHSWTTRMVWDPRTSHFVMVCATDNNCRIAQPNPYRTVASGTCDGTLFGGDIVLAGTTGYWTAWSQGGTIRLEHFTTGASDKTVMAGSSQHPHLVSLGTGRMLLTWGSGSGLAAQVYDSSTGATVGSQFTIAVPDHPWQSWKAFPDGSAAYAAVGSASSTVQIARAMPCAN